MNELILEQHYRDTLEKDLQSVIVGNELTLYKMMAYQMGWIDDMGNDVSSSNSQRLHPTLCLMTCESLSGDFTKAIPAASSLELVHQFSLIHQDVQYGLPERNNRSTVWWTWGPAQAINAGDGLHAMARLNILKQTDIGMPYDQALRAINMLDKACLRLCEGQYLDLTYQERVDISEDAYFKMVEAKTSSLVSCATSLGALMAESDEVIIETMTEYGRKIGIALQIREDIEDLWKPLDAEMPVSGDLLNKKKSLPIIYALKNATGPNKRALGDVYFKRVMEPEDVLKVIDVLDSLGAKEFAVEKARKLIDDALHDLENNMPRYAKLDGLKSLAQSVITD